MRRYLPERDSKTSSRIVAVVTAFGIGVNVGGGASGKKRLTSGCVIGRGGIRGVESACKCHWPSGEQHSFIGLSCTKKKTVKYEHTFPPLNKLPKSTQHSQRQTVLVKVLFSRLQPYSNVTKTVAIPSPNNVRLFGVLIPFHHKKRRQHFASGPSLKDAQIRPRITVLTSHVEGGPLELRFSNEERHFTHMKSTKG